MTEQAVERVYVTNADVIKYAKRGCALCYTPGLHHLILKNAQGQEEVHARLCPHAWNRYLKANMDVKHDDTKKQFYKETKNDHNSALGDAGSSNS
jgi:protein-arginine kinase activator protein McsA